MKHDRGTAHESLTIDRMHSFLILYTRSVKRVTVTPMTPSCNKKGVDMVSKDGRGFRLSQRLRDKKDRAGKINKGI